MPFLQGPYQTFGSLPSPTKTTLHSSRKIDFVRGDYVIDDDGNPAQMPSTRQRVIMAVATDYENLPRVITDQSISLRFSQIQAGIKPLVDEGAILIRSITVEQGDPGIMKERVDFKDLRTGIDDTYERKVT